MTTSMTTNRGLKRFFDRPVSAKQSKVYRMIRKAKCFAPLEQRQSLAVIFNDLVIALISVLLCFGNPSAVIGFVVSVDVFSFDGQSWFPSRRDCPIVKLLKRNAPCVADSDSASTVIAVAIVGLSSTSSPHLCPRAEQRMLPKSMLFVGNRICDWLPAPTRFCIAAVDVSKIGFDDVPAFAQTANSSSELPVLANRWFNFLLNRQLAKRRLGWDTYSTHDATPISRLRETLSSDQLSSVSSFYGKAEGVAI